jgi:hypothetical protein
MLDYVCVQCIRMTMFLSLSHARTYSGLLACVCVLVLCVWFSYLMLMETLLYNSKVTHPIVILYFNKKNLMDLMDTYIFNSFFFLYGSRWFELYSFWSLEIYDLYYYYFSRTSYRSHQSNHQSINHKYWQLMSVSSLLM